ncbi:MAG: HEAT repeat domain-containing protein [Chitinispirillaceae bacterium]|nr:HEAT repeat domain-containing protein [Chitinispirillaceae bacterium]
MEPFFTNIRSFRGARLLVLLCAACSFAAVDITLKNGASFTGDYSSQNDNFIVLRVGTGNVSIAKSMIATIAGLPQGVTVSLPEKETPAPKTGDPEQQAPSQETSISFPVLPGQELEIKLKNGSVFKGTVITSDDRIINLQAENGSRINVYTHIISSIVDRTTGRTITTAQPATPSQTTPEPLTVASETPQKPTATPPPEPRAMLNAPSSAPSANKGATVIRSGSATPPVNNPGSAGATAAAVASPVPVVPAAPLPVSAPGKDAAPPVASSVPPHPQPAATAVTPTAAAVPVKPKKRADGKSEVMLKNGTVFIGTIVSENDRFLAFSTSHGTTINIIRRLIKTLDGVPYARIPGAGAVLSDTARQFHRPSRPRPSHDSVQTPSSERSPAATGGTLTFPVLPKVEIKPGISANECADSLRSSSMQTRAAAARQLGAMGPWASGSVPMLVKLLADTSGFSDLPLPEIDSVSIQRLLAPGFEAARSLARIGEQGIEALKRSARSSNPLVRQRAVFGLGYSQKQHDAVPFLRNARKDPESGVRVSAAHGLGLANETADLISMLEDRDGDVRTYAASALAALADPQSTAPMIKALKDARHTVRKNACIALGRMRSRSATAPLLTALADIHPAVRAQAASALAAIADTAAVNPLCAALKDKNSVVRKSAALALEQIRDPRAIPSLYSAIQSPRDSLHPVMERVLKAHTEIPLLIAALDDSNNLVRENAAYILWLLTGKDIGEDKQAWTVWYKQENAKGTEDSLKIPKIPQQKKQRKKK